MLGVLDAPPGLGCELMASSIRDAASARGAIVGGARVLTLPGRVPVSRGHLHPLTRVKDEILDIFRSLGFEVAWGPEVELETNNFEKLAFPPDHPATDMQDSFWVDVAGGKPDARVLLRTHTSNVQVREMSTRKPPMAVVSGGAVFRRDDIKNLCLHVLEEAAAVGRADGARLDPDEPARIMAQLLTYPPEAGTSMYFDRAAGRSLRDELVRTTADRFTLIDNTAAIGLSANGPVPDVFLVVADPGRPETTLRLLSDLRSRPATRHCAICLLVPRLAGSVAAIALDLGADDLIDDAAAPAEIALRLSAQMSRQRRADRLRHSVADGLRLAMTDPLTGLHNRRYALPKLEALDKAARANGRCYALMLLDLDRFKTINDSLGHAAGDAVLVEVAERLRANLRPGDIAARFGGEEFVIAAPDMSLASARAMAERIRHTIEEGPVLLADGRHVRVTLSIGLAMGGAPLPAPGIGDLIEAADRALLRAKTRGRNQVTIGRDAA